MKNKDDCLWFGNMCCLYGLCHCTECEGYFSEKDSLSFTDEEYEIQFKKSYEKGLKSEHSPKAKK